MKMQKLYTFLFCALIVLISSCSDPVVDAAGTCITCTNMSTTIEACADGDGNLDVVTTDASGASTSALSTDFNLQDFQVAQEATGSVCN